ncbi:MAG: SUMF1/EgtB/PvdO family nonheme iron enzyme [Phormidesmis sp.]
MSKNWAICIGINEYENLPSLSYAVRDAVAMRDFFLEEGAFEEVFYFSDDSPPIDTPNGPMKSLPTYAKLKRFFRELFQVQDREPLLGVGDNVWFFFAGHGELHEGHDYLMPIDVDPGNVDETALRISDITASMRNSGADNTVLLVDACRSQGRRSPIGFGSEKQKGIVTFYACSPRQSSYEIEALQQGAFTYALLESFRLTGADSCATVQRIDQYLRHRVPSLNQQYQKQIQTPYTAVEPLSKNCLILLPQRARLEDVQALKIEAYSAETRSDWDLAQQLWTRVLATPGVDQDAIDGLQRIALKRVNQSEPDSSSTVTAGTRSIDASVTEPVPETVTEPKTVSQSPPSVKLSYRVERVAPLKERNVTVETDKSERSQRAGQSPEIFSEILAPGISLELVSIPGGTFQMGSPEGQGNYTETPQHQVAIKPFLMGKCPITQSQWKAVAALPKVIRDLVSDPAKFKGDNRPVEQVSWGDAFEFCGRLSRKTGREYRLPSEAEWEYACRAGTTTPFYFGEKLEPKQAQCRSSNLVMALLTMFSGQTAPVGNFPANAFGLYDMYGNVWEWCLDHWHNNYVGSPTDGSACIERGNSSKRPVRGGSWDNTPDIHRSAYRIGLARQQGLLYWFSSCLRILVDSCVTLYPIALLSFAFLLFPPLPQRSGSDLKSPVGCGFGPAQPARSDRVPSIERSRNAAPPHQ